MAVDTRNKRMSMITLASPVPMVLPDPDGTISAADRSMLLWLYHGITLSAAVTLTGFRLLTLHDRKLKLALPGRALKVTLKDRP